MDSPCANALKETSLTKEIPVIFISALAEMPDKVTAFKFGAVDYVTKPFDISEVLERVRIHLGIRKMQLDIERQNARLRELDSEKNEFLGIAAHDLKNPLSVIEGFARLLLEDFDVIDGDEAKSYLKNIIENSARMYRLICNLLDINAIESGSLSTEIREVDLNLVTAHLADVYRQRAAEKTIRVHLDKYHAPLIIRSDEVLLCQIVENLISNAVKFSPLGGEVRVVTTESDRHTVLQVHDTGPGVDRNDQRHLFTKFSRLRSQPTNGEHSTGLGLYITKRLVHYIGGTISY